MAIRIETAIEEQILRITLSGEGDEAAGNAITGDVIRAERESGLKKVLIDVRAVRGRLGPGWLYYNVKKYPPDLLGVRTAVIDLAENLRHAEFHEAAAANAGFELRYFAGEAEALAWLSG